MYHHVTDRLGIGLINKVLETPTQVNGLKDYSAPELIAAILLEAVTALSHWVF
jgi:hypothetical protein